MNIYNAKITFTTHDIGREANSKEEYIESVKMQFLEENNIDLRDDEITILEEVTNEAWPTNEVIFYRLACICMDALPFNS